jgi:ribosome-associated heat shock protein Hsp15
MTRRSPAAAGDERASVRLDKWLWAARFYRTRSLAAQAIDAGQVRVNGERVKPSHTVRAATRLSVRKRELTFDVEVTGISERRGPAAEAATLYRESSASVAAREKALQERNAARALALASASGRPTKRDRRKLEDFLSEP